MTTPTRKCAAWISCGNLNVPVDQLSFRGFCPSCERIALSETQCCFETCAATATHQLGREVFFPLCEAHFAWVQR